MGIRNFTSTSPDREVEMEQRVSRLENAWQDRIDSRALRSLAALRAEKYDGDDEQELVREAVEDMLFQSVQWEVVPATVISDIAHEAADRALSRETEVWDS